MDYLNSLGDDNLPLSAQMQGWSEPRELSHYIVYEAATATQVDVSGGVLQFRGSRKSASELLDIVADKICHVDAYVGSSSSRGYSDCWQIQNALSVRIVTESAAQARALLERLQSMSFSSRTLRDADVPLISFAPPGDCTDRLQVLEVQDRLEDSANAPGTNTLTRKEETEVGWRGLVAMVKWWGAPVMIVMEPLEVFHLQKELSTSMSYDGYKKRQREARHVVQRRWPIYEFVRQLTRWALAPKENYSQSGAPDKVQTPVVPPSLARVKVKVM